MPAVGLPGQVLACMGLQGNGLLARLGTPSRQAILPAAQGRPSDPGGPGA